MSGSGNDKPESKQKQPDANRFARAIHPDDLLEMGFSLFEQIHGRPMTAEEKQNLRDEYRAKYPHYWESENPMA